VSKSKVNATKTVLKMKLEAKASFANTVGIYAEA